jgi:hypothetical protein
MKPDNSIDDKVAETKVKSKPKKGKIWWVDTGGNVSYSAIVGSAIDYYTGLNFWGILSSRLTAGIINSATGGPYGWWREKICELTKTTEESIWIRRMAADVLAFNTFQLPIYVIGVAAGTLISEGELNLQKIQDGAWNLFRISPLIGPTMGMYMNGFRKLFGIKPAEAGAYKQAN